MWLCLCFSLETDSYPVCCSTPTSLHETESAAQRTRLLLQPGGGWGGLRHVWHSHSAHVNSSRDVGADFEPRGRVWLEGQGLDFVTEDYTLKGPDQADKQVWVQHLSMKPPPPTPTPNPPPPSLPCTSLAGPFAVLCSAKGLQEDVVVRETESNCLQQHSESTHTHTHTLLCDGSMPSSSSILQSV